MKRIKQLFKLVIQFHLIALFYFRAAPSVSAAEIYATEFEEFVSGPDMWADTNGWLGNSKGVGVHGIDIGMISGLGNTGFLGGSQPLSPTVTLLRPVDINPTNTGVPFVSFEVLMGIEDSINNRRDDFIYTFYNIGGEELAAIRFSNQESSYGIWRRDGNVQYDTGVDFLHGELHILYAEIDFASNKWSADLDGIPLFTNAGFNASGKTLSLGSVAVQWDLTSNVVTEYGDNWMLVADFSVRTVPQGATPFFIAEIRQPTSLEEIQISWLGEPGFDYHVEYSDDLAHWTNDFPNSTIPALTVTTNLSYTAPIEAGKPRRYYRIRRTDKP